MTTDERTTEERLLALELKVELIGRMFEQGQQSTQTSARTGGLIDNLILGFIEPRLNVGNVRQLVLALINSIDVESLSNKLSQAAIDALHHTATDNPNPNGELQ